MDRASHMIPGETPRRNDNLIGASADKIAIFGGAGQMG
jgi:hypothetical protein